ncbi:MAG: BMP family ABC transporter substrate-binding protein [Pseudomonadota bacterium]
MMNFRNFSRRRFLNTSTAAGASLLVPNAYTNLARAQEPLAPVAEADAVIAFGHVGPTSDEGWTWAHDQGMKAVEAAFPQLRTLFVESIPYSADATRTFRQFVSEGANMIFATSNYGDFFYDVAQRAPDVAFYECDGRNPLDNLGWYYLQHWYPTYVCGIAAGMMSETGKLGYVASFPVPSVYSGTNAFLMGARSVNPDATLQAIVINSWFDPQAATQAGTALIDNGCDFLFGIMDEAGYLQVAEQRGVKAVMWNTDLRRYGPTAYVSSIVIDFNDFYVEQVRRRLEGTWTPTQTLLPLGSGIDRDAWGETVPENVRTEADSVRQKMLDGWSPFTGEIKDASGEVRVPEGHTMSEIELYNWDWAIEGVSGITA